jgi:hypothetical protein
MSIARLDCSFDDPFVVPFRHQALSLLTDRCLPREQRYCSKTVPACPTAQFSMKIGARRPHRVAHASTASDVDRDIRHWVCSARAARLRILSRVTSCGLHRAMRHIAIAEALNGKVVDWMEHVSDEQIPRLMISTRNRMQPTRAIASSAKRCAR